MEGVEEARCRGCVQVSGKKADSGFGCAGIDVLVVGPGSEEKHRRFSRSGWPKASCPGVAV